MKPVLGMFVVLLMVFPGVGCAASTSSPESAVRELCAAIKANDTKTILAMEYDLQKSVSNVRANNPKFVQEDKIKKLYSDAEQSLNYVTSPMGTQDLLNKYRELKILLAYNPSIKILEVRALPKADPNDGHPLILHEVYVKLTFPSVDECPYGAGGDSFSRPLRETTLRFNLIEGKFVSEDSMGNYNVIWNDISSRITYVYFDWWVNTSGSYFRVMAAYRGNTPVGGTLTIGSSKFELKPDRAMVSGYWSRKGIDPLSSLPGSPVSATLDLRKASGEVFSVKFKIHGRQKEGYIPADVLNNPWKRLGYPSGVDGVPAGNVFELQYEGATTEAVKISDKELESILQCVIVFHSAKDSFIKLPPMRPDILKQWRVTKLDRTTWEKGLLVTVEMPGIRNGEWVNGSIVGDYSLERIEGRLVVTGFRPRE